MSEPCVCDLTVFMRTRLLCGIYNHRSVPPRWRPLARAYCVTLPIAISSFFFSYIHSSWYFGYSLYVIPSFLLCYLSILVSLWTGDEYIYKFFEQNNLTDVSLDSRKIFSGLQIIVTLVCYIWFAFYAFYMVVALMTLYKVEMDIIGLSFPLLFVDQLLVISCSRNLLIMALFDARLLVLKRRLQRYGFRTVGRAQPQPYCQVYGEILRGLDETDQPLKLLLFFDIICNSCKFISSFVYYVFDIRWKNLNYMELSANFIIVAVTFSQQLVSSFGCVAYLESGSVHCEDMAVFTVTQLVKAPTAEERRRIREFLGALEQRGARYHVLRALPLDARFMLRVLSFCTAQFVVIATAIWNADK